MSTRHINALPIGSALGDYRIERLLGHGGFGLTYLARDTRLNALYAIKEFLPQDLVARSGATVAPTTPDNAEAFRAGLERFEQEARALARFRHPNIVRVTRLLEANGTAYMVMEYEPGLTLAELLDQRQRTLTDAEALAIVLPILDGLDALHAVGLIHRDIKPSNVFLRTTGGPMLIDFGAVRSTLGQNQHPLTATFTPGFAPIEQHTPDAPQGPPTDLYAVGAMLYRATTGRTPTDAVQRSAALGSDQSDPLAPATRFCSDDLSFEFLECIDWALEFRPEDRPQNAHALRQRFAMLDLEPAEVVVELNTANEADTQVGPRATSLSPTSRTGAPTATRTPSFAMRLGNSVRELRRRSVFKVGAAYIVLAFALVQLMSSLAVPLGVAAGVQRALVLGALGAFPVVLLLAWSFDLTPQGIRFTRERRGGSLRRVELALIAVMTAVVVGVGYRAYQPGWYVAGSTKPTLMVLEPEDLRPQERRSDGLPQRIQESVLDTLANDPTFAVISRSATADGIERGTSPLTLAKALGASHFIESSIKSQDGPDGGVLVVTVQLIDVATGQHVVSYSEAFRSDLPVPMEQQLATGVAGVTRLMLAPPDWAPGGEIVTRSAEAAQLFRIAEINRRYAVGPDANESYGRALTLDPDFEQARAGQLLGLVIDRDSSLRFLERPPSPTDGDGPSLAHAHALWWVGRNAEAQVEMDALATRYAGDPSFHVLRGWVHQANERYDDELASFERGSALDPYFRWPATQLAMASLAMHRYDKAVDALANATSRWPRAAFISYWDILARLAADGNTKAARARLKKFVDAFQVKPGVDGSPDRRVAETEIVLAWLDGDLVESARIAEPLGHHCFWWATPVGDGLCAEDYVAWAQFLADDRRAVRHTVARINARIDAQWQKRDPRTISPKSVAFRNLTKAYYRVLSGERIPRDELERLRDAEFGETKSEYHQLYLVNLAVVFAWSGERGIAVEMLRQQMDARWGLHPALVARDPIWATLYGDPAFEKLLLGYGLYVVEHPAVKRRSI